ncbi:MAG: hypothetical protein K6A23_02200 [Butyrivibrio sp.]|nr:hypothetical protein [Butyrivibrio sp.]
MRREKDYIQYDEYQRCYVPSAIVLGEIQGSALLELLFIGIVWSMVSIFELEAYFLLKWVLKYRNVNYRINKDERQCIVLNQKSDTAKLIIQEH